MQSLCDGGLRHVFVVVVVCLDCKTTDNPHVMLYVWPFELGGTDSQTMHLNVWPLELGIWTLNPQALTRHFIVVFAA